MECWLSRGRHRCEITYYGMTIETHSRRTPRRMPVSDLHVLAAARLSPLYSQQLQTAFTLHDRLHETDAAAFARVAPQIRAVAAQGETRVSAELMALLLSACRSRTPPATRSRSCPTCICRPRPRWPRRATSSSSSRRAARARAG